MTNKYHNRRVESSDGRFDSVKEYARWRELKLLEKAGKITALQRQVRYELLPAQKDAKGKVIERRVDYIADFVYYDLNHHGKVVEDAKGEKTDVYILKRKLMLYVHGIRIREV